MPFFGGGGGLESSRSHFKPAGPKIGLSCKVLTQICNSDLVYGSELNISEVS